MVSMYYSNTPSNIENRTSNTIKTNLVTDSIIDNLKQQDVFNRISISAMTLASNHINIYDATSSLKDTLKELDISSRMKLSNLY